ncbi:MAG: 3-phosphoshikimate 1-carboxyvinyltransferase [Pyrinomonadaceae bacterium]
MLIRPAKSVKGEISLPGDKSISHRAAILSAMADGVTRIDNFATSVDCASTLRCLESLGVNVRREGLTVWIEGVGKDGFHAPNEPLDCGNSGTTMRLLSGVLAGQRFDSVLTGDDSLAARPMGRVIDPLMIMGGGVSSLDGRAPLTIHGRNPLRSIGYTLPVASAQIKSCILLAGLNSDGETTVVEPVATRDHTERMLRWFGVDVRETMLENGKKIAVAGDSRLSSADIVVPSDISSAAFFLTAALCLENSLLQIRNVGLNSSRAAIIETLRDLGAGIETANPREQNNEPVGDICVRSGIKSSSQIVLRGEVIANMVDELPILAVLGTQIDGGLEVRDAGELRVKETDRIAAIVENLRRLGAEVDEFDDGFRVGRSRLKGARVDSFGDHRIAMAFAVAGLLAVEGETEIVGSECVDVSFPGFFEVLEDVVVYE